MVFWLKHGCYEVIISCNTSGITYDILLQVEIFGRKIITAVSSGQKLRHAAKPQILSE